MQRLLILTLIATTTALVACATSPLGRSQLQLFPESQMAEMGVAAFQDMKQQQPLETSSQTNGYVSCVARAIIAELPEQRTWEVQVFKDDSANAFALPGGKIGVHTGLLDIAENQDQLATVIGHEVAHALHTHANECVDTHYVSRPGRQLSQVPARVT